MRESRRFRQAPPLLLVLADIIFIGLALVVFALFDHVLPQEFETEVSAENRKVMEEHQKADEPAVQALGAGFAGRFTEGEPVWTETSYTGRNLSVTLSSGQLGRSIYYVQDIYLRDIECLRTAFGQDTYGKGYAEDALALANRKGAVGAINGDYYCLGSLSVIIRDGTLYRDSVDPLESVLVLYRDGSMEVFEEGAFTVAGLIERDAWQTWSFGPSLLDADGHALTEFERKNPEANPRTALGMVEPGHYIFIVVDGRQDGYSYGMTYVELAQLCEQLGMKVAYNLDGGGSARMTFHGALASRPSENREVSDIVYIVDVE